MIEFCINFEVYCNIWKYRFYCNINFIHSYYQGIKFVFKEVIVFISYPVILILLKKILSLFYLLMDLIIHVLAVQFKQIEVRYLNTWSPMIIYRISESGWFAL